LNARASDTNDLRAQHSVAQHQRFKHALAAPNLLRLIMLLLLLLLLLQTRFPLHLSATLSASFLKLLQSSSQSATARSCAGADVRRRISTKTRRLLGSASRLTPIFETHLFWSEHYAAFSLLSSK
jgi:hypothetical protein